MHILSVPSFTSQKYRVFYYGLNNGLLLCKFFSERIAIWFFRFGDFMGFNGKKLKVLSLGSGQEEKARDVIRDCSSTATWVLLLNCHLVPDWMDELE